MSSHSVLRKHVVEDNPSPIPTGHSGKPLTQEPIIILTYANPGAAYRLMVR